jgi:hypothetical protein
MTHYRYSYLPEFFPAFGPERNVSPLKAYDPSPSLIRKAEESLRPTCGSWAGLQQVLADEQAKCPLGIEIKVLLIGRHCQGGHNAHIPQNHGLSPKEHRTRMRQVNPNFSLLTTC